MFVAYSPGLLNNQRYPDHILDPCGDVVLTLEWFLYPEEEQLPTPETEERASVTHKPTTSQTWSPKRVKWKDRGETQESDAPKRQCTTFRLSSHHLIRSSPAFKALLTGDPEWARRNRKLLIEAEQFYDPEAMKVVLDVVHSRSRQIPKTVSLELLAKISKIVSSYAIHEAMELVAPAWVEHLLKNTDYISKETCPAEREVEQWISVAYVFNNPAAFMLITQLVMQHGRGQMFPNAKDMVTSAVICKKHHVIMNITILSNPSLLTAPPSLVFSFT